MSESLTIKSGPPEHPAMDFSLLREKGLAYIRQFAADTWTDHNTHDPGITILEALCYAITDLGYRLSYDMEDLLAPAPDEQEGAAKAFFQAPEILPSDPVSVIDYRKMLIDVEGVKNAWIEPVTSPQPELFFINGVLSSESDDPVALDVRLKGLSRILIEKDDVEISDADLLARVGAVLSAQRNLCEDFSSIVILPSTSIIVRALVEIKHGADPDKVLALMYHALSLHISPNITFHSLNDMKALAKREEEIFNGPYLKHGFIDDDELSRHQRKIELHLSDMIHVVMELEDINGIQEMKIAQSEGDILQEWVLQLENDVASGLTSLEEFCEGIELYKDGILCNVDPGAVRDQWELLQGEAEVSPQVSGDGDLTPSGGAYRALGDYETIQNHFPNAYGIGLMGLPDSASAERKAQAGQLQAYLTVFDQILANYFSQLDHARQLLAIPGKAENRDLAQSYFPHPLSGIPGEDKFLDRDPLAKSFKETESDGRQRRNRIFDHLLARFGERFPDISHLAYDMKDVGGSLGRLLDDKSSFLADYPAMSKSRGSAFNYGGLGSAWDTENVSGLKRRICGLLGIGEFQRKKLAESATEGFHLVEHILLRPRAAAKSLDGQEPEESWQLTCNQPDPYSYAVTYLFPKWPGRFSQDGFKNYVQELLAVETPVHISFSILWLDGEKMKEFEEIYERWLPALAAMAPALTATESQLKEISEVNKAMTKFLGIDVSAEA